jgi:hypothetical protein
VRLWCGSGASGRVHGVALEEGGGARGGVNDVYGEWGHHITFQESFVNTRTCSQFDHSVRKEDEGLVLVIHKKGNPVLLIHVYPPICVSRVAPNQAKWHGIMYRGKVVNRVPSTFLGG